MPPITFSCQTALAVIHGSVGGAEFYEKRNCQPAGLCRFALDAWLAAAQQAQKALNRALCRVMGSSTIQPKEDIHHGKS